MKHFTKYLKAEGGSQIAEAAVVLPLLIMVVLGIMWFGRAFNIYATINRAAREAAQAGGTATCATCGNGFPGAAALQTSVVNPILNAAHLDPAQATFSISNVNLNATAPVEAGRSVTLSYPYSLHLNGFTCCPVALTPLNTGITITATAQARDEK